MKQTSETEHEFVENVPDLEIPSVAILPTNSKVILRPCQYSKVLVINVINNLISLMHLF